MTLLAVSLLVVPKKCHELLLKGRSPVNMVGVQSGISISVETNALIFFHVIPPKSGVIPGIRASLMASICEDASSAGLLEMAHMWTVKMCRKLLIPDRI